MPAIVENKQVLTEVPADRVEKVTSMFRAEGARSIKVVKAVDGTYRVEAVFESLAAS